MMMMINILNTRQIFNEILNTYGYYHPKVCAQSGHFWPSLVLSRVDTRPTLASFYPTTLKTLWT